LNSIVPVAGYLGRAWFVILQVMITSGFSTGSF